jgi:hypothetical protein
MIGVDGVEGRLEDAWGVQEETTKTTINIKVRM